MVRCCLSLGIVFFALSLSLSAADTVWNQWRGPDRDGRIETQDWPERLQDRLQLEWEQPLEPSYSGPVVWETSDGRTLVYTTETIEKQDEQVSAFDLKTGERVWQRRWPGAMSVPFFAAANGDWIRSTPVVGDGYLLVLGMRDVLVCLDPETGEESWRVDFPAELGSQLPAFGAVCSPLVAAGGVYVQTGGALVKLDLADGSVLWQSLKNGEGMSSSGAFSSPTLATLAGERQLVVQTREELCGVDLKTGSVLWREAIEAFRGMNILTPLVIGDTVFTSAHSGKAQRFRISRSGAEWQVEELWAQKLQAYMSSPVLVDETIYMHMKNQRLAAIDVADGSIRWTSRPFGKYWSMVAAGDQILSLDASGTLRLLAANPETLEIVDAQQVGEDTWAHLAVTADRLVIRDLTALKVYRWKR